MSTNEKKYALVNEDFGTLKRNLKGEVEIYHTLREATIAAAKLHVERGLNYTVHDDIDARFAEILSARGWWEEPKSKKEARERGSRMMKSTKKGGKW